MSRVEKPRSVRRRFSALWAALFIFLALMGCATEPETGRWQVFLLSEREANEMGAQSFQQVLATANVSTNPEYQAQVERVGRRIARVTDARMAAKGRELYKWDFKVFDDPKTANAFALPGGKVAVYTGILSITKTDAGLAVVLGHEIAHAYAQHGRSRVSQQVLSSTSLQVVQQALGGDQASDTAKVAMLALGVGYHLGAELPFSRADESAADEIGLGLMAEAGYDPREAVAFWQRMEAAGGSGQPQFLSTHPSHDTRIERLQELLPKATETYERFKGTAR